MQKANPHVGRRAATAKLLTASLPVVAMAELFDLAAARSSHSPEPPPCPSVAACPLSDRVSRAIEGNPYLARRNLRFEAHQGRVVLRGRVGSFFQKQMAQEALRAIDGVAEIENELEVCWD